MARAHVPILALLLFAASCTDEPRTQPPPEPEGIPFRHDGDLTIYHGPDAVIDVQIEIAETDSARNRGLMQRNDLPDRAAMLFVFPAEQLQRFWMANTQLSLDFLFVDAGGIIVSTVRGARPLSVDPVESGVPAQYVVEFEAGFLDTWGIVEGDSVAWRRLEG